MTDTELKANFYALEKRIYQLERDMRRTANIGDLVEVDIHLYGDVYERKIAVIKDIAKTHGVIENKEDRR